MNSEREPPVGGALQAGRDAAKGDAAAPQDAATLRSLLKARDQLVRRLKQQETWLRAELQILRDKQGENAETAEAAETAAGADAAEPGLKQLLTQSTLTPAELARARTRVFHTLSHFHRELVKAKAIVNHNSKAIVHAELRKAQAEEEAQYFRQLLERMQTSVDSATPDVAGAVRAVEKDRTRKLRAALERYQVEILTLQEKLSQMVQYSRQNQEEHAQLLGQLEDAAARQHTLEEAAEASRSELAAARAEHQAQLEAAAAASPPSATPSERDLAKETIAKLEKSLQQAREEIDELVEYQVQAQDDIDAANARRQELQQEHASLQSEMARLERTLEETTARHTAELAEAQRTAGGFGSGSNTSISIRPEHEVAAEQELIQAASLGKRLGTDERASFEAQLQALQAQTTVLETQVMVKEEELRTMRQRHHEELAPTVAELEQLRAKAAGAEMSRDRISKLEESEKRLLAEHVRLTRQQAELQERLAARDATFGSLQQAHADRELELEQSRQEAAAHGSRVEQLNSRLGDVEALRISLKNAQEENARLSELVDTHSEQIATSNLSQDEQSRALAAAEREIAQLRARIADADAERATSTEHIASFMRARDAAKELTAERERELDEARAEISRLESDNDALENELKAARLAIAHSTGQADKLAEEKRLVEDELADARAHFEAISDHSTTTAASLGDALSEKARLDKELREMRARLDAASGESTTAAASLEAAALEKARLESELDAAHATLEEVTQQGIARLEEAVAEKTRLAQQAQASADEARTLAASLDAAESEKARLEAELDEVHAHLQNATDQSRVSAESSSAQVQELQRQLSDQADQHDRAMRELSDQHRALQGSFASAQQQLAAGGDQEAALAALGAEKAQLESAHISLAREKAQLESAHSGLQQEKAQLESAHSGLQQEKAQLESTHLSLAQEKEDLEDQVAALERHVHELETEAARRTAASAEALSEARAQGNGAAQQLEALRSELVELERARDAAASNAERLERQLGAAEEAMAAAEASQAQLEAQIAHLTDRLHTVTTETTARDAQIGELEREIANAESSRDAHAAAVAQLEAQHTEKEQLLEQGAGRILELQAVVSEMEQQSALSRSKSELQLANLDRERESLAGALADAKARHADAVSECAQLRGQLRSGISDNPESGDAQKRLKEALGANTQLRQQVADLEEMNAELLGRFRSIAQELDAAKRRTLQRGGSPELANVEAMEELLRKLGDHEEQMNELVEDNEQLKQENMTLNMRLMELMSSMPASSSRGNLKAAADGEVDGERAPRAAGNKRL